MVKPTPADGEQVSLMGTIECSTSLCPTFPDTVVSLIMNASTYDEFKTAISDTARVTKFVPGEAPKSMIAVP